MANTETENCYGVVDRRRTQNQTMLPGTLGSSATYTDVGDLRARLTTAGGIYTTAYLNQMTKNDMVYAVRLLDDAAGF